MGRGTPITSHVRHVGMLAQLGFQVAGVDVEATADDRNAGPSGSKSVLVRRPVPRADEAFAGGAKPFHLACFGRLLV
jgi:hypothetical protein